MEGFDERNGAINTRTPYLKNPMDRINAPKPDQLLIVGTGALATLFAWQLARAHYDIMLLGSWQPGVSALRENGARLVDANGTEQAFPVRIVEDASQCHGAKHAIVLVKSWQTRRVARQLAECLSDDGLAITLQNGLGNYEILVEILGKDRVTLGSTTAGATLLGPGLVRSGGEGIISIQSHPHLAPVEEALRSAGFKVEVVADANSLVWGKLVINSAINPLTALLRVPNGELLKRPTARAMMRALAQETAAVAFAERVNLTFGDPAALVEDIARRTAGNYSSMFQDVRRGTPTEIEAICGAVARTGRRDGVPTPMNDACWQLVQALSPSAGNVPGSPE